MRLDAKAILGVAVTVFLLWYIQRGVPFADVWANIGDARWDLFLASVAVATFGFLIRALRWHVLLRPVLPKSSLRNRFAAVNIGFMANNLLPARIGEFARAYTLSRIEPVRMTAALGSLVVERLLDALVLLGLLLAAMASPAFPDAADLGGGLLATAVGVAAVAVPGLTLLLLALIAFPRRTVRLAERVAARLPVGYDRPVVAALEAFLDSLGVLRSPRLFALALLWSVGFWLWHGLSFWLAMLAFDIEAGLVAAYFTEAVVGFGVAVPAAPGFFGTFHASAGWALSVFGVPDARALAFAYGYHLGGFIPVTAIGLYYAGRLALSLEDMRASEERVETAVRLERTESRRA